MRWVAVVLLCGCNALLGLDETAPIPFRDTDNDGIEDAEDNCPEIANPGQEDADDDGIGDACDGCDACAACPFGPNHDEDGDHVADGCDNCPAQANEDQENADGDDLGDACDLDTTTAQRRVLFDGFGTFDPRWTQVGGVWEVVDDAIRPQVCASCMGFADLKLIANGVEIDGVGQWYAETQVSQAPIGVQQGFGLGFGNTCFVEQLLPDRWKIFANSGPDEWPRSPGDQVPGAKMRLRFSIIPPDANGFRLRCEVVGVQGGAVNNVTMPQGPFGPVFLSPATYGIPFDYIDVVE